MCAGGLFWEGISNHYKLMTTRVSQWYRHGVSTSDTCRVRFQTSHMLKEDLAELGARGHVSLHLCCQSSPRRLHCASSACDQVNDLAGLLTAPMQRGHKCGLPAPPRHPPAPPTQHSEPFLGASLHGSGLVAGVRLAVLLWIQQGWLCPSSQTLSLFSLSVLRSVNIHTRIPEPFQ